MPYFPQLSSGAMCQLSARRVRQYRVTELVSPDGHRTARKDPGVERYWWTLRLDHLSPEERHEIESLFLASQGRLKTFVFLDPMGNLFDASEDLGGTSWLRGPALTVSGGATDVFGGSSAWTMVNGGPSTELTQRLSIPPAFQYSLSAYVRSTSDVPLSLVMRSGGAEIVSDPIFATTWTRIALTASLGTGADPCLFGVVVPAGATITCCGMQLEAQASPSRYKKSLRKGGVYANARFGSDRLSFTSTAPGTYSTIIDLTSPIS